MASLAGASQLPFDGVVVGLWGENVSDGRVSFELPQQHTFQSSLWEDPLDVPLAWTMLYDLGVMQ